jgi:hypothetical protein
MDLPTSLSFRISIANIRQQQKSFMAAESNQRTSETQSVSSQGGTKGESS